MATDIGARIGLDGASDFRRELKLITQQSKELDSEMKMLTSSFDANDRSQENLKSQSELLGRQIDTQKSKVELLSKQYDKANTELGRLAAELQDATQAYGQNSTEAQNALRAYQNQSTTVSRLQTDINRATTALNKMQQEQKNINSEIQDNRSAFDRLSDAANDQADELAKLKKQYSSLMLEQDDTTDESKKLAAQISKLSQELQDNRSKLKEAADAADELDKSLEDVEDSADDAGGGISSLGDIISGNVIASGISDIVSGIKDLHESSIEYRTIMASLEISSERAGYTAQQTEESYSKLIGVLGDTQTAATTVANLQAIGYEQDDLQEAIDGVIGAWATYGDSIPIDSLAESVTETIKTSSVTGTFADVLNWAGENEDDFNLKLQSANSNTERANIVLKQLARQGLVESGKAWQENNESLVEYNKATDGLDEALAVLGEKSEPLLTKLVELLTGVINIGTKAGEVLTKDLSEFMPGYENSIINLADIYTDAALQMNEADQQQLYSWIEKNREGQYTIEWYRQAISEIESITGQTLLNTTATEENSEAINKSSEAQNMQSAAIEDSTVKLGEQLVAFQNLEVGTQANVANITTAIVTMRDTIANAAQNQIDWFGAIDQSVGVTSETVLQSMQTQIDSFNSWGENLAALSNRTDVTINSELLQYLANMGPQGAEYAAAFANMTTEQLQQANNLWKQSIDIQNMTTQWGQDLMTGVGSIAAGGQQEFANLSSQLNFSANEAGAYTGQGFIDGVTSIISQATAATGELGDASIKSLAEALGVSSPSRITRQHGEWLDQGLKNGIVQGQSQVITQAKELAKKVTDSVANGIKSGQSSAASAARTMANTIKNSISANISYNSTYSVGLNVAYGMAAGIRAGQSSAINAAANMAANALAAARRRLDINSPSREFEWLGEMSDKGMANGLSNGEAIRQLQRNVDTMLSQAAMLTQVNAYEPVESAIRSIPTGNTDIQIVVNAADGQSAEEIANMVMYKMQHAVNQRKAVWGK